MRRDATRRAIQTNGTMKGEGTESEGRGATHCSSSWLPPVCFVCRVCLF